LEHGPINNRPDDMKANAKIAALNMKKVGGFDKAFDHLQ